MQDIWYVTPKGILTRSLRTAALKDEKQDQGSSLKSPERNTTPVTSLVKPEETHLGLLSYGTKF